MVIHTSYNCDQLIKRIGAYSHHTTTVYRLTIISILHQGCVESNISSISVPTNAITPQPTNIPTSVSAPTLIIPSTTSTQIPIPTILFPSPRRCDCGRCCWRYCGTWSYICACMVHGQNTEEISKYRTGRRTIQSRCRQSSQLRDQSRENCTRTTSFEPHGRRRIHAAFKISRESTLSQSLHQRELLKSISSIYIFLARTKDSIYCNAAFFLSCYKVLMPIFIIS